MDRYVIREPRNGASYPQGNQNNMVNFTTNARGNNVIASEGAYYEHYSNQFPNIQSVQRVPNSNYYGVIPQINAAYTSNVNKLMPCQGQVMSGIDPRYLAGYSDNSAHFITTGQPIQREANVPPPMTLWFGNDYENRSFSGPEKNLMKAYKPQPVTTNSGTPFEATVKTNSFKAYDDKPKTNIQNKQVYVEQTQHKPNVYAKKSSESEASKKEVQNVMMSRSDKLKALHKSGPRAFSGPVEKVLKWHKALQDIGVFVFYEIVGKCVSVRQVDSCAKNLVVRDDNGPAMQVVYYEVDFLLPELKPPCVVRVIGRMMAGTCRLQAFSVRLATGDDVATLPRRAAVASHHVARLCKEYGPHGVSIV